MPILKWNEYRYINFTQKKKTQFKARKALNVFITLIKAKTHMLITVVIEITFDKIQYLVIVLKTCHLEWKTLSNGMK